jgi:D-3-phosphoglycerate dehydrogenase
VTQNDYISCLVAEFMDVKHTVLICDQVNPILNEILTKNGLEVTYEPEITPEQISEKIGSYEVVVVRSRTKLVKELIEKADNCQSRSGT